MADCAAVPASPPRRAIIGDLASKHSAWTIADIEQVFIDFMTERGHAKIQGHSVIADRRCVFTTAGMHPLTPYLHGEPRLVAQTNLVTAFTVLEAMIGQTYLVTFVARLDALRAAPPRNDRSNPEGSSPDPARR